ncbi:MAG: response regulator transcription factor [Cyclobacteriaceae bacterium]
MKKRIFIVDDDSNKLRTTLSLVILGSEKFKVIGEYMNGEECMKDIAKLHPDIILMNIDLPGRSGTLVTHAIKEKYPHIDIVLISDYEDSDTVFSGLRAGANGYILTSSNYLEVLSALEEVSEGGAPLSRPIARMLVEEFHVSLNSIISKREREVMKMIASGFTYSEISEMLHISKQTSKTHIRNIYTKLKVNSKSQAISKAREERLI